MIYIMIIIMIYTLKSTSERRRGSPAAAQAARRLKDMIAVEKRRKENDMSKIQRNSIVQIGIMVRDLDKVAKRWAEFLGKEPVYAVSEKYETGGAVLRGKPCYGLIRQALFDLDNLQIELISPYGAKPSLWRECLEKDGEGLHHIAFKTDDIIKAKEELNAAGLQTLQRGSWEGDTKGSYAYMDTFDDFKTMIELLEFR